MKLCFEIYKKGKFAGVNIYLRAPQIDLFDDGNDFYAREYLEEAQYARIAEWCSKTFSNKKNKLRVRRMAFADFWFQSKTDLDWFLLHWSGVDSESV